MKIKIQRWLLIVLILGFGMQISIAQKSDLDNKFLIVLDVQNHDTKLLESNPSFQDFMESINAAIGQSNTKNVIYIKGIHLELNISLTFPNLFISLDAEGMQLDERMDKVSENIFLKDENEGNAFNVGKLNSFLEKNNAKEIILIGLMAEECIYQTGIGGLEQGYDIYVIPEAIIGESKESKDAIIKELVEKGIKILQKI